MQSTGPTPRVLVLVQPSNVSLNVVTSQQFQAAIGGGTNLIVSWKVNDVTGGNDTIGTIDSGGLYLAPGAVPSPDTVTIKAISSEDENSFGTATVKILPPPVVTVTPTAATVVSGAQTTFTATVTGAPTTNVDWTVNGAPESDIFGKINGNGVYTAPLSPPPGGVVTVRATSRDYPQASAAATVTVTDFATASFQGPYAFSMSGSKVTGAFFRAGSFFADGAGQLTGGVEDITDPSGSTTSPVFFAGSYTMGTDGRGTMHFNDNRTPSDFRIVLVGRNRVQIIGFGSSGTPTGTATGEANLRDPSDYSLWDLNSTHAFNFSGLDGAGDPVAVTGKFTTTGAGAIIAGLADINANGALTSQVPFTGSYAVDSQTGQGTATLQLPLAGGDRHFRFYIVSRGSAKFVQVDPIGTAGILAGTVRQQAPNVSFSQSSLNGSYAFVSSGSGPAGNIGTAGRFLADGAGQIISGVVDENVNNVATSIGETVTSGSYILTSSGRGTATLITAQKTYQFLFYMGPTGTAVLQETDSSITASGEFAKQANTAFSNGSLLGSYAISINGFAGLAAHTLQGQLTLNGAGEIPTGTLDLNTGGIFGGGGAAGGTYSIGPDGRGTFVLSLGLGTINLDFVLYVVGPTEAFLVEIETGRLTTGKLLRQF